MSPRKASDSFLPPAIHAPRLLPCPRSLRIEQPITRLPTWPRVERAIDPHHIPEPQGFELIAQQNTCRVIAHDEAGLFYAQQLHGQLARQADAEGNIPACRIQDHPDYTVRGVMLDVSRGRVPTMAYLQTLIDQLAEWRINQLQLYTEHTFAYAGHETVWRDASPFTAQEIQAIDAYCQTRHIELIPNQNSFGHMTRWLEHPAYQPLAECPQGFDHPLTGAFTPVPFSLDPSNPETLALLDDLYAQLLPNFSSAQFNVGCDETFDLGQGKNKTRCQQEGTGRVYLEHLQQIHQRCQAHGKRMQFWGDIVLSHPELIVELPPDITALNWGYEADQVNAESCQAFAEAGVDYYVCPGTSSWCSIAGRLDNAAENMRRSACNGLAHQAAGYLITDWGDQGHLQPPEASYLPFAYGASVSWCLASNTSPQAAVESLHVLNPEITAAAWATLGNAYRATPPHPINRSTLFNLLVFPEEALSHERYTGLTQNALKQVEAILQPSVRMGSEQARFAAQLLLFACHLGQARYQQPDRPVNGLSLSARKPLIEALEALRQQHQVLWRETHRPGGLDRSLAYFDRLKTFLESQAAAPIHS